MRHSIPPALNPQIEDSVGRPSLIWFLDSFAISGILPVAGGNIKTGFLFFAIFFLTLNANAKTASCVDGDSTFKMIADFDSAAPRLTASVVTYKTDGSIEHETKNEYLSPKLACESTLDFSSDCTGQEKTSNLGYSYQFKCSAKKISGEFYVDENGDGKFSCSNLPGASIFFGCTVH